MYLCSSFITSQALLHLLLQNMILRLHANFSKEMHQGPRLDLHSRGLTYLLQRWFCSVLSTT